MAQTFAQPFVKWAGGKRRLAENIFQLMPTSFDRYVEPFVGGGAIALRLGETPMLLNDANQELIRAYEVVRDNVQLLAKLLDKHFALHSREYYYSVRSQEVSGLSSAAGAARLIYLNKAGFNGLYRVNRQGQFNVPFGRQARLSLYDAENLSRASTSLKGAMLFALDYATFLRAHVRKGDVVYLDPPYQPIGKYADFRRYTQHQFREAEQIVLAHIYDELIEIGAYPILSNSHTPFVTKLYAKHNIVTLDVSRQISGKVSGRANVREVLITPKVCR
ncbi:MAG: Dam family site-specific DNA-(adenine-N6)-methyltransferase [Anaerolineae bacterium]|nr:Dam family site-specific DNA-(adenine-N6)-methyltransferase [Anaerolineae bacterium]